METSVDEALRRWEPRIELLAVSASAENGENRVDIDVRYRVRATNEERNLVHPFYLRGGA